MMRVTNILFRVSRSALRVGLVSSLATAALSAAEVDVSKLPAPASTKIDFTRDIKPIFENTCYRCHGPEKPKARFRLDNGADALQGGEHGADIVRGDSAKSPLIHYVARLVPDMEMPPPGKGDPLTTAQIALLRAWIDQGADWPAGPPTDLPKFSAAPTLRWLKVNGSEQKFREHHWMREGWTGGVEEFMAQETIRDGETLTLQGRAIFGDDDYKLRLDYEKRDTGFVRGGFEQYRKYFDDTGGYYAPFSPSSFDLNRDLHLDIGKAWVDLGLTLPDWPRLVLGYEFQYKHGAEATLNWGDSTQGAETRKIFPSIKQIDEKVHVIKFDASHEFAGFYFENNFRGEFYDLATRRTEVSAFTTPLPTPDTFATVQEGTRHFQGVNTFKLEKAVNDWLYAAGGYFYSRIDSDAAFNQTTLNTAGVMPFADYWSSQQILIDQETHLFNLNALLGPWQGLSFSVGGQGGFTRQHGFGNVSLDSGDPINGPFFPQSAMLNSDLDKTTYQETVGLRYTQIPCTVLFAEGRFQQETIGQLEQQVGTPVDLGHDFLRSTDARSDVKEYRAGFTVSPWTRVSFTANYRHQDKQSDYNHLVDQTALPVPLSGVGYSAFIRARSIISDEAEAKLVLRPASWLKTTLGYKIVSTDYSTTTDPIPFGISPGGQIDAGKYDANIASAGLVLTPWRRCYLSSTFSYSHSRTAAAQNGNVSVVPYRGDIYSLLTSGTYALSEATDLQATYSFSRADFGQNNAAAGLPLGIDYQQHGAQFGITHRFTKSITTRLQYAFYYYDEPSAGGINNYTAHGLFATVAIKLP